MTNYKKLFNISYLAVGFVLLAVTGCSKEQTVHIYDTPEYKQIDSTLNTVADTVALRHWLKAYKQADNKIGQSITLKRLGRAYRIDNKIARSIEVHKQGLAMAETIRDTMEIVNTLNELGTNYRRLSAMYQATSNLTLALAYCKQWSDTTRQAFKSELKILNGLGKIFFAIHNYKLANKYYRQSLAGEIKLGSAYGMSLNYSDLGRVFRAQGNNDSALVYFQKALEKKKLMKDDLGEALIHVDFGGIYEDKGEYEKATDEYSQAYISMAEFPDNYLRLKPCVALAQIYVKRQLVATAMEYLQEAKTTATEINSPEYLAQIAFIYYNIYRKSGNTEKALQAYIDYKKWSDALVNLQEVGDIQNVQIDELMAQNQRQLDFMHNDMTQMRKLQHSGWIIFALIVMILVIIIGSTYNILRSRTRLLQGYKKFRDARVRFLAAISHELRTPITIIQAAGESIVSQTDNKRIHEDVEKMQEASQNLMGMINNVLDVTRINSELPVDTQWCHDDIVGYVRVLADGYKNEAEKRQIRILVASKRNKIEMDFVPEYVDKIMTILLGNMLHFAYDKSDVYISLSIEKQMLRLEMKDHGQGMAADIQKELLKSFEYSHLPEDKMQVAMAFQVILASLQAMNGDIKLKSKLGEYAQFIISIPLKHGTEKYPRLIEMKAANLPNKVVDEKALPEKTPAVASDLPKILIVEKSQDVALYAADQLKDKYQVFFASNGKEGLQKIKDALPDLIITGGFLPVMDGYQMCQEVRSQASICHIPIIMVSSNTSVRDRMKGLQVGADEYMSKPFRGDELSIRVRQLLAQRRMLREKYAVATQTPVVDVEDDKRAPDFLDDVQRYVDSHIADGEIDIAELASHFGVARATFTRKVKQFTGLTSSAYITSRRLKKACQLLQTTEMSVAQVGEACGFSDTAYFILVFRKNHGKTPKQYKDEWNK